MRHRSIARLLASLLAGLVLAAPAFADDTLPKISDQDLNATTTYRAGFGTARGAEDADKYLKQKRDFLRKKLPEGEPVPALTIRIIPDGFSTIEGILYTVEIDTDFSTEAEAEAACDRLDQMVPLYCRVRPWKHFHATIGGFRTPDDATAEMDALLAAGVSPDLLEQFELYEVQLAKPGYVYYAWRSKPYDLQVIYSELCDPINEIAYESDLHACMMREPFPAPVISAGPRN